MRVHAKWTHAGRHGIHELIVADRFLVKVEGRGLDMGDLRAAAASIDLAGLAALQGEGRDGG
jgi:hypothetical protein